MAPIIPIPNDIPENASSDVDDSHAVNVISDSDSHSDEETVEHDGYEPLSQDPESYTDNQCDLDEDSNFINEDETETIEVSMINHHSLLLPAPVAAVTATSNTDCADFKMDENHIETIKSVMKSITLPTSNLPHWATLVPEEEWKTTLCSEILLKKSVKNSNDKKNYDKFSINYNSSDFQNDIHR